MRNKDLTRNDATPRIEVDPEPYAVRADHEQLVCEPGSVLPIGAYGYSQGLEWAVEAQIVRDDGSAQTWIADSLELSFGACGAAVLAWLRAAARQRLLVRLGARIPHVVGAARSVADTEPVRFAPGLSLASGRHETQ